MERRKLETSARQIAGTLFWVGKLRFNISFDLAVLGTTIKEFASSPSNAKLFLLRSIGVVRELRSRLGIFWYRDFLGNAHRALSNLKSMMILFRFTDAGYASLANAKSTRAFMISFGIVKTRGGILSISSWALATCSGKIPQVARSSLAAEAISVANGIDCLQRTRVYWCEVLYGELIRQFISPKDQFPLQTPSRQCMVSEPLASDDILV